MTAGSVHRPRRAKEGKLRRIWRARELLVTLTRSELKVRYRNSFFGFAWSMVTPLAMMLIFTFIFTYVFRGNIRDFPIFFLAGFLPWQFFANSVQGGLGTIVGHGNLIKKVYFPREVLPLAHVGAQSVHFLLSLAVLFAYLIVRGDLFVRFLPVLVAAIVLQAIFNSGLTMAFAAANVAFRDLTELSQVIFLLWFYATPVIFQLGPPIPPRLQFILRLNPMTTYVTLYRDALYDHRWPSLKLVGVALSLAVLTFAVGHAAFSRLAVSFAKEV